LNIGRLTGQQYYAHAFALCYFVNGKVSIDDLSGLTTEKSIEMIERTLIANGFTIIQIDPDTVEVVGTGKNPRSIGVPVISNPKALSTHERVVSFIFHLKYRDVKDMQQIFGQYLSPPESWTSVLPEPKSNTLVVTERTSAIRSLTEIAAEMDVPTRKKER
jgi:type II secretory pathway component GspD/PulD (secretin)